MKNLMNLFLISASLIFIFYLLLHWNILGSAQTKSPGKLSHKDDSFANTPKTGRFRRVILMAKARTGSSFIGAILAKHDNVFYSFEPLTVLSKTIHKGTVNEERFFKDILNCNFSRYTHYQPVRKRLLWHLKSGMVEDLCRTRVRKESCDLNENEELICRRSETHLIKTINLNSEMLLPLLKDPRLNVGIIYLLRDPRGTYASRKKAIGYKFDLWPSLLNISLLCRRMSDDLIVLDSLKRTFPSRVFQLLYEDFAFEPINQTRKLFRFLGWSFTPIIENFIMSTTSVLTEPIDLDVFNTRRNSKTTAFKWRAFLPFKDAEKIQKYCGESMRKIGYRIFFTPKDYKNLSIHIIN